MTLPDTEMNKNQSNEFRADQKTFGQTGPV